MLDDATRDFVRRSLHAGLLKIDDIKKVVASLMTSDVNFTAERIADGLVGADLLTQWQARKLLAGKARGFYLGNYRLLRPLGKGGMGIVFLAQHAVMNRLMALKILPPEATKDQRRVERFKEEARASAQLEHPNIVQAYDFADSDGKLYIVMEYIEGVDLQRAVSRDGVMSSAAALDAILQTTDGLAHAHQRGIIHRDIKPSNLLLRDDGIIKVSDMGLARIGFSGTAEGDSPNRLTGTADFVAPEQAIDSKTVDARADIYSLGCTWYYLLTGKAPFPAKTVAQRLANHQTAAIPLVSQSRSDCPAQIVELIQRMMSKRPEDRPASAAELLQTLKRIATSNPSGDALANRPRSSGTSVAIDDSSSFPSLDDSGPLQDATPSIMDQEIDFGALPAIEAPTQFPSPASVSPPGFPPAQNKPAGSADPRRQQVAADPSQGILLGIGLATAIAALLVAVGVVYYQMNHEPKNQTRLKSTEDGKGNVIVVTGD